MKLTITIQMDNAAFEEAASREVERILREIPERLADSPKGGLERTEFPLRDINGNTVGKAKVTK